MTTVTDESATLPHLLLLHSQKNRKRRSRASLPSRARGSTEVCAAHRSAARARTHAAISRLSLAFAYTHIYQSLGACPALSSRLVE